MNNKIVSVVLVAGIAATGFAGISAASETSTGSFFKGNVEAKELFQKAQSGEELTADEQTALDNMKAQRGEKGAKFGGKRKGGGNLTDEEKAALEAMSDEEKQAFFDAKKEEMKIKKETHKSVIDKLINGESLTADEEAMRLEMLATIEDSKHQRNNADIIAKVLAGDALTEAEETELADMQAKKAEREAQRAIVQPIREKQIAGETLSDEEQAVLDEMKGNRSEGKVRGGYRGHGNREAK